MNRHVVHVPEGTASDRLDRYLAGCLKDQYSRVQIQKWIKSGHLLRNGKPATSSERVGPGDTLILETEPVPFLEGIVPEPVPLNILHEDDAILVINKPAGLVVHPGAGHSGGTLVHGLLYHTRQLSAIAGPSKPGVVHRLDKDTSGVMVVAKTDGAHRLLSEQFAKRTVRRTYVAVVHGRMAHENGTISAALGRHPKDRQKISVQPPGKGRDAITHYKVLRRFPNKTYIELTPETGRTHQLRVHLHHLGHPILGDPRYGPSLAAAPIGRQALHALRLEFVHPVSGQPVAYAAALPVEINQLLSSR